jgi:hypothetical protein
VRLEEMVGLLEELALSKVKEGDEDAARSVLKVGRAWLMSEQSDAVSLQAAVSPSVSVIRSQWLHVC